MQERPLLELALETSEVFVDQLIDNPLAKEIPIVGSALKVCKAFDNVRNRIFAAKLATFINTISSADEAIRSKWRDRTSSSPEECTRIGSFLLVVIEQTNDLRKAEIFGLLFIAFADRAIDEHDMSRLIHAVDVSFTTDIVHFLNNTQFPMQSNDSWMDYLRTAHLTEYAPTGPDFPDSIDENGMGITRYNTTALGEKLRQACLHAKKHQK